MQYRQVTKKIREGNLLEPIEQADTNEDDNQTHTLQPRELVVEDEDSSLHVGHINNDTPKVDK